MTTTAFFLRFLGLFALYVAAVAAIGVGGLLLLRRLFQHPQPRSQS